jgi:hypothetical protein
MIQTMCHLPAVISWKDSSKEPFFISIREILKQYKPNSGFFAIY